MQVFLTGEAKLDLFEAADYYEAKEAGLGKRLRNEIADVLSNITASPYLWRERTVGYRRVNCPVFPYYVAYVIRNDAIYVVAIAHGSRKPGFWHDRLAD